MRIQIVIYLLLGVSVFAQKTPDELIFQPLSVEDGLPHNYVHSITQDKKGFIWIGTNYGLARYDGYSFKVFQPDNRLKNSITHKPVSQLFADSKSKLWFAINSGGINKMDINTEQFKGYFYDLSGEKHLGFYLNGFYEDDDSVVWLASENGLFKYNSVYDAFENALINIDERWSNTNVNSFADDKSGYIWLVFWDQLCIVNKETYQLYTLFDFTNNQSVVNDIITGVYVAEKGKVWLSTRNSGLILFDLKTKVLNRYLSEVDNFSNVFVDKQGNVFSTTNNPDYKLYVCKKEEIKDDKFNEYSLFDSEYTGRYMQFLSDNLGAVWISSSVGFGNFNFESGFNNYSNIDSKYGLPGIDIENMFIDRTDNVWIVPYRLGVYKADIRQKPFINYDFKDRRELNSEKQKTVASVYIDSEDKMWLGESDKGFSCFDRKTNKFYRFHINTLDLITSVFEDKNGYLWLGAYWDQLTKVKKPQLDEYEEGEIIHLPDVKRYDIHGARKIVADKNDNLWFATLNGLVEYHSDNNEFINQSKLYDSLHSITAFYRTVFIDRNNDIWGGSNNGGLCKYDRSTHQFTRYLHDDDNSNSISSNTVYYIKEESNGILLVGTTMGLNRFFVDKEIFEQVLLDGDLSQRSIFSVYTDSIDSFWMSSDKGVIQYNNSNGKGVVYGPSDGIMDNEFTTTASFMTSDGEIFYGGSTGLFSFYPYDFKPNPIPAKPAITNLMFYNKVVTPGDSVNDRILLKDQIWNTSRIEFNYDENDFSLELSALHYSAPEKVVYEYRLLGFNDNWVMLPSDRRWANFTGLQPGNYMFEMRATNNDGILCDSKDEVKLQIVINPPIWQTNRFRGLIVFVVLLLVYFILKSWYNYISRRKKQLEKMVETRTTELAESNHLLKERQEEISVQNEELANTNVLLEERQEEIENQNEELRMHRGNLEELVQNKTQELKKALDQAEESDKLKTAFLANLSHEIRTPMNAIIGFSNLLPTASIDELDHYIGIINNNCDTLLVLINDIIDISMIEADLMNLYYDDVKIHSLLLEIKLSININAKPNVQIIYKESDVDLILKTDEYRLRQIINNLLINAIKFTEEGSVTYGYEVNDKMIRFYVRDTGIGMSQDDIEKIFEHFHKKELVEGKVYRGTGIGLSICKKLVELLGGEIGVMSERGKGTEFYFTLPII